MWFSQKGRIMTQGQTTDCIHHWLLGEPHYGKVDGVCRRCGAQRTFPSGLEFQDAIPDYAELSAEPEISVGNSLQEEHVLA